MEKEKVYCPYCAPSEGQEEGVEMVGCTPRMYKTANKVLFLAQYYCPKCNSYSPVKPGNTAAEAHANAHAAALNRCKPLQRPLSWWEACEDDYYLEIRGAEYVDVALNLIASCTDGRIAPCDSITYTTHDEDNKRLFGVDYGKTWRCWKRRPTDEERAAAKWLEEEGAEIPVKKCDDAPEIPAKKCDLPVIIKEEEPEPDNQIAASGYLENGLIATHEYNGEPFYEGVLQVARLSGVVDSIPVIVPGSVFDASMPDLNKKVKVRGQVRRYSMGENSVPQIITKVYVQEITETQEKEDANEVKLAGVICRPPRFRTSPFGREICEMLLLVERWTGKHDYVQCVTWASVARFASNLKTGEKVRLSGRLQSRVYQKMTDNGEVMNVITHEVSAFRLAREGKNDG